MRIFFFVAFMLVGCLNAASAYSAGLSRFLIEAAPHARAYAVRQERDSLRFELRAGDCAKTFDCKTGRERSEIKERWRAPIGQTIYYSFEILLPANYPEMDPKQILGQWHDGARPALSNRYENGRFWIDLMGGTNKTSHRFEIKDFRKGNWEKFSYAVRWSDSNEGRLKAWHNGRLVADYHGPTLSAEWNKLPRFKFGIYRSHLQKLDGLPPTQVAYFSDYKRYTTAEASVRLFEKFHPPR